MRFHILITVFIFLIFFVGACSMPSGNFIPFTQEGMELSDSFTPGDTIQATTQNARVKLLGSWYSGYAKYFFHLEVENTGTAPIKLDFNELKPTGTGVIEVKLNYIEERNNLLESGNNEISLKEDSPGSNKVTIKPKETKKYAIDYTVLKKDGAISAGDIVKFAIPGKMLNDNKEEILQFEFKCVSSSDLKYIQRGPGRKTEY